MTPPTFWRRKSQRPRSPLSPSERDSLLVPTQDDEVDPDSSAHTIRHLSSNATIRLDYDQQQQQQVDAQSHTTKAYLWQLIYAPDERGYRSTAYLIIVTLSFLGAQMAWSLELSYGTPYLLSLGLSPQATSLVWLAGPIAGLVAQPVVGCLSDASNSKFKRRYYMLVSTFFIFISTLTLAFAQPVSEAVVDFFALGLGDWDPVRQEYVGKATRTLAVGSFWILDFALNAMQASGRALVLDRLQGEEIDAGNVWLGRMTHIGNILGYTVGYLDLSRLSMLSWLGGDQFRKFALIALTSLLLSVGVTCSLITETYSEVSTFSSTSATYTEKNGPSFYQRLTTVVKDMVNAVRRLPRPIRRVCLVQIFAFMGWFPFLFFATTYIGTFEQPGHSREARETRERRGTEGMLLFASLSLLFGSILPFFSLAAPQSIDPSSGRARLRGFVLSLLPPYSTTSGSAEPIRGKGISLRTFWTVASLLYTLFMCLTFFVSTSNQAILLIGAVGSSWGIASWVPFTLVMAFVKEAEDGESRYEFDGDFYSPGRTRERIRSRRASMGFPAPAGGNGVSEDSEAQLDGSPARKQLREALGECGKPLISPTTSLRKGRSDGNGNGAQRSSSVNSGSTIRNPAITESESRSRRSSRLGSGSYIARGTEVVRDQAISSPRRVEGDDRDCVLEEEDEAGHVGSNGATNEDSETKGGTILGIHNVAIVLPQFLISIVASLIFKHFDSSSAASSSSSSDDQEGQAPGVVWVLRFGGLAALLAAFLTRLVPLTQAERRHRYDLMEEEEDVEEDGSDVGTIGEEGEEREQGEA